MAFEVAQVIGSGSAQELICQTIQFCEPVEEIKAIQKTVIIDNCKVVFDKVIIDGRLRKNIMAKQACHGFPIPGTVSGCSGVTNIITGNIIDVDLEINFIALIPVPGAQPGDRCEVLQAFVEGEKEEPANITPSGAFHALIDKSIIFLCVKAVREVITTNLQAGGAVGGVAGGITAGGGIVIGAAGTTTAATTNQGFCPARRSTGFFPGGQGLIPAPTPGPLPGTWIGPTLVFPGVLNPGIPTRIPPTNHIQNNSTAQIQVTPVQGITTPTGPITGTAAGGVITAGGTAAGGVVTI